MILVPVPIGTGTNMVFGEPIKDGFSGSDMTSWGDQNKPKQISKPDRPTCLVRIDTNTCCQTSTSEISLDKPNMVLSSAIFDLAKYVFEEEDPVVDYVLVFRAAKSMTTK
jgi:hypothetical protein